MFDRDLTGPGSSLSPPTAASSLEPSLPDIVLSFCTSSRGFGSNSATEVALCVTNQEHLASKTQCALTTVLWHSINACHCPWKQWCSVNASSRLPRVLRLILCAPSECLVLASAAPTFFALQDRFAPRPWQSLSDIARALELSIQISSLCVSRRVSSEWLLIRRRLLAERERSDHHGPQM